jgi:hypothetical protein
MIGLITPGIQSVTVNITPGNNNGSAITEYYYSTDNGDTYMSFGILPHPSVYSFTITYESNPTNLFGFGIPNTTTGRRLQYGIPYTILLKASNDVGVGAASTPFTVIPYGPPNAPTNLRTTGGDHQLLVTFTPGLSNGAPITNYLYSTTSGSSYTSLPVPTGDVTSIIITRETNTLNSLRNGILYGIFLKAVNANGISFSSSVIGGIPYGVPLTPVIGTITPGDNSISVAVTTDNNGSSVYAYYYSTDNGANYNRYYPGTYDFSTVVVTNESNTGARLTNGNTYTVLLKAENSAGIGPVSAPFTGVAYGTPDAPIIVSRVNDISNIIFTIAPSYVHGSPIIDYEYSTDGTTYKRLGSTSTTIHLITESYSSDPLIYGISHQLL